MQDLTDLYQSVILDHNRRPRNYSVLPTANRVGSGNNPMCGDQITVYVKLDGDRITFSVFELTSGTNSIRRDFTGRVSGGAIEGTVKHPGGEAKWSALLRQKTARIWSKR